MATKGVSIGIKIDGDAKGFKSASNDAAKATAELKRKAHANSREIERSFKQVTIAIAKIGAAVIVAKKAFDIFASVMKTTEGGSDKLEEAIGGVKEGLFELQRALAAGDFSNLINNLIEGVKRGKELTKALDDLADRAAYNDYIVQGLKGEKALLEEIVKNRTLELSVRADAAAKVIAFAEKVQKREEELALKAFQVQKRLWEGRNKMATEEAIKLYETIDNISSETEDRLARGFKYATDRFGVEGIAKVLSGEKGRGLLKGIPEEVIQSYGKYLQLLESGEADVLPKLFATHKNYLQTITDSQVEFNEVLRITTSILAKEDNALEKSGSKAIKYLEDLKKAHEELRAETSMPESFVKLFNPTKPLKGGGMARGGADLAGAPDTLENIKGMTDALSDQKSAVNDLASSFGSLGSSIGGAAGEWMSYIANLASTLPTLISAISTIIIAKKAKTSVESTESVVGAGAAVANIPIVGPILAVAAMAAVAAAILSIPKFAGGGIVSGPILAQVGEYAGARNNPEVIAPLSKLKGMLGDGVRTIRVVGKISGRDIFLSNDRYSKLLNNNT